MQSQRPCSIYVDAPYFPGHQPSSVELWKGMELKSKPHPLVDEWGRILYILKLQCFLSLMRFILPCSRMGTYIFKSVPRNSYQISRMQIGWMFSSATRWGLGNAPGKFSDSPKLSVLSYIWKNCKLLSNASKKIWARWKYFRKVLLNSVDQPRKYNFNSIYKHSLHLLDFNDVETNAPIVLGLVRVPPGLGICIGHRVCWKMQIGILRGVWGCNPSRAGLN